MEFSGLNILMTVYALDGYHGSAIQTMEYAEYYAQKNRITIVCMFWSPEVTVPIIKNNIRIYELRTFEPVEKFDVVIGLHHPVVDILLNKGLNCDRLVLGSLSRIEPLELFPRYYPCASLLFACSERVKNYHVTSYNIPEDSILVLENPIPDIFYDYIRDDVPTDYPRKIAIISNHPPKELVALSIPNVQIDKIGQDQSVYSRVTPELLAQYDVVISIGKTVQYALGLGIPVYEYDICGGNGYISNETILRQEAANNFNGSPQERVLTTEQLKSEIMNGYAACRRNVARLRNAAYSVFSLPLLADLLLKKAFEGNPFDRDSWEHFPGLNWDLSMIKLWHRQVESQFYSDASRQTIKCYWKTDEKSFNENNCIYGVYNDTHNVSVRFVQYIPAGTSSIRIDPCEQTGCLLEHIQATINGNPIKLRPANGIRLFKYCLFLTSDPRYILEEEVLQPMNEDSVLEVSVQMRVFDRYVWKRWEKRLAKPKYFYQQLKLFFSTRLIK